MQPGVVVRASCIVFVQRMAMSTSGTFIRGFLHRQGDYFGRVFSLSSACFNSSSFCPASPSLPSAVRRW